MTPHKDIDHFSDDVGGRRWLCNDFSAIWTCFLLCGAEPGAQATVAVGVAAGNYVGFVEKAFADFAGDELADVVEIAAEGF